MLQWSVRYDPDQAVRRESNPTASTKLRLMKARLRFFFYPDISSVCRRPSLRS